MTNKVIWTDWVIELSCYDVGGLEKHILLHGLREYNTISDAE